MRSQPLAGNITPRLETHCEVLQKARGHLPQSGTDGKVMRSTENLSFLIIGQTRGSGTWTTSRTSTSTTMLARAERTICESSSFTKFLTRASRQDHYGKDQRIEKRKRNCQIFSSQQGKNMLLIFKQVTGSVNRTDSTLHNSSTWNG